MIVYQGITFQSCKSKPCECASIALNHEEMITSKKLFGKNGLLEQNKMPSINYLSMRESNTSQ
jgi:hypothetical protein